MNLLKKTLWKTPLALAAILAPAMLLSSHAAADQFVWHETDEDLEEDEDEDLRVIPPARTTGSYLANADGSNDGTILIPPDRANGGVLAETGGDGTIYLPPDLVNGALLSLASREREQRLADPAFAHYVSEELLSEAWSTLDPGMLIDAGLQFAEAERILLRNHETIQSGTLFQTALKSAIEQQDKKALARLAKVAQHRRDEKLAADVAGATQLAAASRAPEPTLTIPIGETTVEEYTMIYDAVNNVRRAVTTGNSEDLDLIEKEVMKPEAMPNGSQEYLKKIMGNARSTMGEKATVSPEQEELLGSLDSDSRGGYIGKRLGTFNKAIRTEAERAAEHNPFRQPSVIRTPVAHKKPSPSSSKMRSLGYQAHGNVQYHNNRLYVSGKQIAQLTKSYDPVIGAIIQKGYGPKGAVLVRLANGQIWSRR